MVTGLDFSIAFIECCNKLNICDITPQVGLCCGDEPTTGYGFDINNTKYDVAQTLWHVKFPDGTEYQNVDFCFVPAARSYGQFQITGGTTGSIVVDMNGVLLGDAVFTTDVETTIDLLVNDINGSCKGTNWIAEKISTDKVKVISLIGGTDYNGLNLNVGLSGDITTTMIDDPTAYGAGTTDCFEIEMTDIYGSSNPPSGNAGPNFQDGVYTFTYIILDSSGIEIDRKQKLFLFDCNVKACVKKAVLKLGDSCCNDCDDKTVDTILKIKSKIEQANYQLDKGLIDCANKTIKSAGKLCTNLCLDC